MSRGLGATLEQCRAHWISSNHDSPCDYLGGDPPLGREDPLRHRREDSTCRRLIYLDGNSLGPLPRATRRRIEEVVAKEWGQG